MVTIPKQTEVLLHRMENAKVGIRIEFGREGDHAQSGKNFLNIPYKTGKKGEHLFAFYKLVPSNQSCLQATTATFASTAPFS